MAIILGKKHFGRLETLQWANKHFNWPDDVVIGISCFYGFWAYIRAKLTRKRCIYYCIDFYSPEIAKNLWDRVFIWSAMQMDKFLISHVDKVWDISVNIDKGRERFGKYQVKWSFRKWISHQVVPLSYPPEYFRMSSTLSHKPLAYVGLEPYGLELIYPIPCVKFRWLGGIECKFLGKYELLNQLCEYGIGIALWKEKGNNYYGDPGKTKLYLACGLPVVMTANTAFSRVVKETEAGVIVDYTQESVEAGINKILANYDYYKQNVKKTWGYINAEEVFRDMRLLD